MIHITLLNIMVTSLMEKEQWNPYVWNHWYFDADMDKFNNKDDFLKNYIILGFNRGNKWNKPKFHIRVFSDELWNGYLGITEE